MSRITRTFSSQMRALKSRGTSELMLDMLFAAAVPMIISGVAMEWRRIHPRVFRFFTNWVRWGWRPMFVRTIEYEKNLVSRSLSDDDGTDEYHRNNILHRAILLYMGQELNLRHTRAQVLLSAVREKATLENGQHPRTKKVYGGTAEQLKAYSVNITPPRRGWVSVGDGVFFCEHDITDANDREIHPLALGAKKTVIFTFASSKSDGDLRIEAFLNKAFLWYCEAMKSTEDHFRYYYTPLTEGGGGANASALSEEGGGRNASPYTPPHIGRMRNPTGTQGAQRYKRYRLGNDKTFDTLFFPEKELLLKILDNFQHKTGKYGIKGYPHKLGLLLHGPPGTGKSSLIKALALHTERHVIDVPLARIQTNQDLMDIMFDQSFPVAKQDLPISLSVENVIFVMEDVDATSPIVRARESAGNDTCKPAQPQQNPIRARKPRARRHDGTTARAVAVSARAGAGRKEEPPPGTAESIDLPAVATSTTPATTTPQHTASPNSNKIACTAAHGSPSWKLQDVPGRPGASVAEGAGREANGAEEAEADNNSNEDGVAGEKGQFQEGRTPGTPPGSAVEVALLNVMREAASKREEDERKEKTYASMTDQLDLAGLLNVLDGVVDSPGRIVIMTTNFPDALDAALIRPGRMDKKIHLGYMKYEAAKEMTRHFFQVDQLTASQDERLRSVFGDDPPSPGDDVGSDGRKEAEGAAGRKVTPAVVEQLVGEFDYVDDFIGALEAI